MALTVDEKLDTVGTELNDLREKQKGIKQRVDTLLILILCVVIPFLIRLLHGEG